MEQPFIKDFNKINPKDLEEINAFASKAGIDPVRQALEPTMKEFMRFIQQIQRATFKQLQVKEDVAELFSVNIDYDIVAERERFLRDIWDNQAKMWALIEKMLTYYLTMLTILEKLEIPADRYLSIASFGSGPGLYETFLALYYRMKGIRGNITCVDFAPKMTEMQKFVMSLQSQTLNNLRPITANMADVPLPDASVDAVICNNSLQWCLDWRKAIAEMARILNPNRQPWAYIVFHIHEQSMHARTDKGESPLKMEVITGEQIMDELEKNKFTIYATRQIKGNANTGQVGQGVERVFLKAKFTPNGLESRWRNATKTIMGAAAVKLTVT